MSLNYQQLQRLYDITTFRNELGKYFIGNIMRMVPPAIQYLYDKQLYNKAQNTLHNQNATQLEQAYALRTISELDYKYANKLQDIVQ